MANAWDSAIGQDGVVRRGQRASITSVFSFFFFSSSVSMQLIFGGNWCMVAHEFSCLCVLHSDALTKSWEHESVASSHEKIIRADGKRGWFSCTRCCCRHCHCRCCDCCCCLLIHFYAFYLAVAFWLSRWRCHLLHFTYRIQPSWSGSNMIFCRGFARGLRHVCVTRILAKWFMPMHNVLDAVRFYCMRFSSIYYFRVFLRHRQIHAFSCSNWTHYVWWYGYISRWSAYLMTHETIRHTKGLVTLKIGEVIQLREEQVCRTIVRSHYCYVYVWKFLANQQNIPFAVANRRNR